MVTESLWNHGIVSRQSPIPSNGFYIMTKILLKKMAIGDDLLRILPDVQTKCIVSKVFKSNMHSPPTRKLGKWWQMWYDDFGFYRFTTFMVCLKFRTICLSPEFSLASDQKLRWRLLTILIIHAACMVYYPPKKIWQLMCSRYSVETAPRNSNKLSPLPSKRCRNHPTW